MKTQLVKLNPKKLKMLTSFGLTDEQILAINMPTPKQWIKKRVGRGGKEFDYIPIGIVIKYLNSIFGFGWSWEIKKEQIFTEMGQILVEGKLSIHIKNKIISKESFGSHEIMKYGKKKKKKNYKTGKYEELPNPKAGQIINIGDDCKAANSLCITKCASMFGLFSDIYSSEFYSQIEMPDGDSTIEEKIVEIEVDNNKAFSDLVYKLDQLKTEKKKEMANKILATPPFALTPEQKQKIETLCQNT